MSGKSKFANTCNNVIIVKFIIKFIQKKLSKECTNLIFNLCDWCALFEQITNSNTNKSSNAKFIGIINNIERIIIAKP